MDISESDPNTVRRKRTESNSGNSDSDASDGWNIVDHLDVQGTDAPSSDGESVEVIDAEFAYREEEEEYGQPDSEDGQLLLKPETPVVPADQGGLSIPAGRQLDLPREEMFDSSFCWFLFIAVSAVLMSDVAFMVAESVLDWNVGVSSYVNQPSFLSDLPVTPKLPQQVDTQTKIAWANKEEVTVDSIEIVGEEVDEKIVKSTEERLDGINNHSPFNENRHKSSLKINNHDVGKYFRDLSDVTVSNEAQNKFSQTLLILDALHIGLNDLEDVVTESSELHQVLKSQKETLVNVLAEIRSGVSRSMEKMATNVLDKVQRLERNFEIQWCRLEKSGHKDELKGLFYECQENEEKRNHNNYDQRNQFEEKSIKKSRFVKDSYQYEVDKDSTGKEYRQENSKENDVYFDFVKNERHGKNKHDHENENKHSENSRSQDHLNPVKDEKTINVDEINEYENKYKQKQLKENKKYENLDKLSNYDKSAFNNEKYNRLNNQKSAKHENSGEHSNKKPDGENCEKYNNAEFERSERKDLKKDYQTKIFESKRSEDTKSKHYKNSGKHEDTNSKNQHIRHDENLGKFEHVRTEGRPAEGKPTYSEQSEKYRKSNQYEKTLKFESSKDYNHEEKGSRNVKHEESKLNEKYYNLKSSQKDQKKNPDESTYQKSDYDKNQKPYTFIKRAAEKLGKYLKEKCDKNRQKTTDLYNKVKEGVKEKMKIPMEMFNNMFNTYCSTNKNNQKKDEHRREQLKGDYKRNSHDRSMFFNDESIKVEDNGEIKSFVDLKLADSKKGNGSPLVKKDNNVVEQSNEIHQWKFIYPSPSLNNESNVEGDWFIKSGESRSKARWHQHRSDWLFDRASHRRGGVHSSSHNWLAGRRKNWFFRRAWAREQCRETPDSYWCHPSQDETVTIPSASFS